jgi:hypothetical protein
MEPILEGDLPLGGLARTHQPPTLALRILFLATLLIPATFAQEANRLNVAAFGPVGLGGDDTEVFQTALNWTAALGQTLEIPASSSAYNIGPLYFPSNTSLFLDAGVVVQARPGFSANQKLLNIVNVSNVHLQGNGAVFRMRKAEYTSGEYRHCLNIEGASDVSITSISCNDSGGDGLYIGAGLKGYSARIQITDAKFDNNRRQGMSITSGIDVTIRRCNFTSTSGTAPADGIDLEPNEPDNFLQNISIQDSVTGGNAGNGVGIDIRNLNSSSAPVAIVIERHTSYGNQKSGYYAINQNAGYDGVTGSILICDSRSSFDSLYGAVANFYNASGPTLTFQNLTVENPNQAHATDDNTAVAVIRGGGGQGAIGNVSFVNTSITDISGSLDRYFIFVDYSNIGLSKIQFIDPGVLFGAPSGGGLLMNHPVTTVDVR